MIIPLLYKMNNYIFYFVLIIINLIVFYLKFQMHDFTYNLRINDCTLADNAEVSFKVKDTKSKPAKLTVKGTQIV